MSAIAVAQAVIIPAFPDVEVANRLPNPLPPQCIRVSRAGGPQGRDLDRPRILVEVFASTPDSRPDGPRAEHHVTGVDDALRESVDGGPWAGLWISRWDLDTIVEFPDPDAPQHARWQLTGSLHILR